MKLTPNALKSLRGNVGPAGDIGRAGSTGTSGGFDPSKIAYIVGPSVTIPAETVGFADATCPSGSVVIGGGFFNSITAVGGALQPQTNGVPVNNDWRVIVSNNTVIPVTVFATAICVAP